MNMNLTLARVIGLLAALGAGLTAFTGTVTSSGGYKAAAVAAFSAIVATWIHEEHSTDRNATTASTQLPPASSGPSAADFAAVQHAVSSMLGNGIPAGAGLVQQTEPAPPPAGAPPAH